ncbi:MAG: TatD family hydrolase [Phycisphaerales bacterium]|jgi:TatD DNase family protein|nr:TatD family hydrolase [Phycisphaerales bacterium]
MFDTHCHLTGDRYRGGIEPVLDEARAAGIDGMVAVAVDAEDAAAARDLAEAHADVWFSAGVHPSEAGRSHVVDALLPLIEHPRCVAWGEMGLDGHWPDPPLDAQRSLFARQLALIQSADADGVAPLPVILHSRKAVAEVLAMIEDTSIAPERFVFHCFTEGPARVEQVLRFGAAVSFTGVVTYRNAAEVAAASDCVPIDRLMVETDSPYLTPEPRRGERPNRPANVVHVAQFLALRRGLSDAAFEQATDDTARRIFGIG